MRNRRKTLLRDHSVPEVTLKAYPRHNSVSAILETLTVRGPKRPPKPVNDKTKDIMPKDNKPKTAPQKCEKGDDCSANQ